MPIKDEDESSLSPAPLFLTLNHVAEAVARSPDGGNTLFLSKLGLSDIGANEANGLALAGQSVRQGKDSIVERLALGNNRLTTLPTEFALLTHLRYLNLRHNSFPSFPEVLTLMSSLDTLDISYNKIRTLPPYPGNLTRLRVFSFSRNKITKLPTYLTQFRQLEVMQCDRNPIDWPPPSVLEPWGDSQDIKKGREWVRSLQGWMEAEVSKGREFDDSGYSEQPDWGDESSYYDSWRFPTQDTDNDLSSTPHARSFSVDSDSSSILNPVAEEPSKPPPLPKHRALNLTTDGKYLKRSPDLVETLSTSSYTAPPTSGRPYELVPEPEAMHLRTASHASPLPIRKIHTSVVAGKKSLPDLRTTRDGRKGLATPPERRSPNNVKTPKDRLGTAVRQDSGSSSGSLPPAYEDEGTIPNPRVMPLVAVERSSYFKRSSVIPANHSLPKALLVLLESARGILFSMGQLYQTLDQYVHHGGSDRLAGIFKKVLDPTNITTLHLIRSLDRFDDVSQKSSPSAAVCRALVESCRDTVNVFRKAVALLSSQVAPEGSEDTRYVRWLILELYAASAELSHSWQAVVSQLESLRPFLSSSNFLRSTNFTTPSIAEVPHGLVPPTDPLAPAVRLRPIDTGTPAGRTRTARRHAGSFSTKDVQMGKELPSYDLLPSIPSGLASPSQTPTIRTPKRMMTTPNISTPTPNSSTAFSFNAPPYFGSLSESASHQRGLSQSSLPDGSFSPSVIHDSPAVTTHKEKGVLKAVENAVRFAPDVWDQIEEALDVVAVSNHDIQETIEQARSVTKRLSDNIAIMSEGYSDADKRLLRENAHLFLKTLVQLSNILKTYGTPRSVPASLRANMVKLTNATEEFSLLLHVSSVSSYTPHPYSPTLPNSKYTPYNQSNSAPSEDNQLGSSLSRSRSEQPTLRGTRPSFTSSYDNLRNALPLTSAMKSSGGRRLRPPREVSTGATDPG